MRNGKVTEDLRSCPFCGEAELHVDAVFNDVFIQCLTCNATGPNGGDFESAQVQWNARDGVLWNGEKEE